MSKLQEYFDITRVPEPPKRLKTRVFTNLYMGGSSFSEVDTFLSTLKPENYVDISMIPNLGDQYSCRVLIIYKEEIKKIN